MQASDQLQRFHEKTRLCDGNSFPLGFPIASGYFKMPSPYFSCHSKAFSSKKGRGFLKKREKMRGTITEFQLHGKHITLGSKFYVYAVAIGIVVSCFA